jgi:hypothetical protein
MDHMFTQETSTRRRLMGFLAAAASTQLSAQVSAQQTAPVQPELVRPPRQDNDLVSSFVGLAHNDKNLEKVADMLSREPKLVYATWDWGGGDWETGLGGAAHTGSRKMARLLLEKGARIDAFCAAMLGERDVVAALVAADAGVVKARGPHGYCLLYHAAISGDVRMVETLSPHLTARDKECNQALSAAVRDGHLAMTSWLLNNGVTNPNQGDGFGKRPIAVAIAKGFTEIAEELRKHGASEAETHG